MDQLSVISLTTLPHNLKAIDHASSVCFVCFKTLLNNKNQARAAA